MHFSRRFPCIFFLLLCLLFPDAVFGTVALDVRINDLDKDLSANILARLRIYQQRENPKLSVGEMRRLHRKAVADIQSALEPLGYYSPRIESALIQTEGVWHASYTITPGEPVRVHSVSVEVTGPGGGLSLFAELEKQVPLRKGGVLHHQQYEDGKKNILNWARRNGFIEAQFTTKEIRVRREKYQADIELLLDTGHRFLFGKTHSDQEVITARLLSRYIPYKEGEPYSSRELTRLQSILYDTGFFSGVTVEPEFDRTNAQRVPVSLSLTPALANRYSFGLGYGTDTGVRGKMEWKNRLFNDRGHKVQSSLQLSQKINKLDAAYQIPIADPRYDALKYAGSWASEEWEDTKTDLLSVAAALSHAGPKYQYGATLEVRDENYDVGVTSGYSLLLLPKGSWSVVFADNRINAENGWRFSVEVTGANEQLLSDATFVQALAGVKGIWSPWERWRLIGRFTLGSTLADSIDDLPPSLRFYAGGDQSVRGYAYKSIGPVDASGTVIGGRYLKAGSMEVEREVTEMWSVAAFYDAGEATDDVDVKLKNSVGLGGRITLPFGQIRMDIGIPLQEEDHAYYLHLNVGADL
jgi:translocation and assembly module TamA